MLTGARATVATMHSLPGMDSDKLVFERLQKEFEAARAAQTEEISLDGEEWNDGLLATIREQVHMEADRKAMPGNASILPDPHYNGKTTYKAGNKKFIDYVGEILQAYVDRREQVRLMKELYGNQIGELYHSISFSWVEFVLEDFECKITVSLRYADIVSAPPTRVRVLAWPLHSAKKIVMSPTAIRKGNGLNAAQPVPARLTYAEDALRTTSLPEGVALFDAEKKPRPRKTQAQQTVNCQTKRPPKRRSRGTNLLRNTVFIVFHHELNVERSRNKQCLLKWSKAARRMN
ncbi:hypothetical protein ACLOJK_030694 [Asimina triloba]